SRSARFSSSVASAGISGLCLRISSTLVSSSQLETDLRILLVCARNSFGLQFASVFMRTSARRLVRAALDVYLKRRGILCLYRVVASKLKRKEPLVPVWALNLEAASGQAIQHVYRAKAAVGVAVLVGVVANPPKVFEVRR